MHQLTSRRGVVPTGLVNARAPGARVLALTLATILSGLVVVGPVAAESVEAGPVDAGPPAALEGGYAGLVLRDLPDEGGTVVSWILPGPLDGAGITSPTLCRPDVLVAVNGQPMDAAAFRSFVESSPPGTAVSLTYRPALRRGGGIPDVVETDATPRTVEIVLDARDAWTGTVGRARGHDLEMGFDGRPMLDPDDPENILGGAVALFRLGENLQRLQMFLATWPLRESDFHQLSRVRAGFTEPFRLPELADAVADPARNVAARPIRAAAEFAAQNLDAAPDEPLEHGTYTVRDTSHAIFALDFLLNESRLMLEEAFAGLELDDDAERAAFARQCLDLLRVPRETFLIEESPRRHIEVIRRSMHVDFERLTSALRHLDLDVRTDLDFASAEREPLPAALLGAVEGPIITAERIPNLGWLVLGSTEDNRYDMTRLAGVFDPGGDDHYLASDLRLGGRAIIDLGGDDLYTGTPEQGPGAALLGLSFIDDRAGNDRYEGGLLSTAASMFGVSLLLDRAGDDEYVGGEWSIGAACYGAAVLVDLAGSDLYQGEFLCQGVGGPRGAGAVIDAAGRDLYRVNGPHGSAYGTPAVYRSFSQGFGFGYRQYANGGIGLLADMAGDDRYEAGEFAQGGGYYYGLGVLHDAAGRDLYYGNRYGQGFGVHQAFGALVDEAGDDTYWSMTAASQGAAWDEGVGLLLDRAGNDSYQADNLAQGAAANQAIAFLVDEAGDDRYAATGPSVQGTSGGNAYHYHRSGAFSFSLLLDRGGRDWYSSGRPNNDITRTGRFRKDDPKASDLDGLVIDVDGWTRRDEPDAPGS